MVVDDQPFAMNWRINEGVPRLHLLARIRLVAIHHEGIKPDVIGDNCIRFE